MGNISGSGNRNESNGNHHAGNTPVCPVCNGKKYILVATRKVSHMSTVYERQECHVCVAVHKSSPVEETKASSTGGRKNLSGTGYLRNKKRRRKEEE